MKKRISKRSLLLCAKLKIFGFRERKIYANTSSCYAYTISSDVSAATVYIDKRRPVYFVKRLFAMKKIISSSRISNTTYENILKTFEIP